MAELRGTSLDLDSPSADLVSAYKICFDAERIVLTNLESTSIEGRKSELLKKLKNVRILGHLLAYGPSDESKNHIATTILYSDYRVEQKEKKPWLDVATAGLDMLVEEGQYYDTYLLRPCQSPITQHFLDADARLTVSKVIKLTPSESHPPSRPSIRQRKEQVKVNYQKTKNVVCIFFILDLHQALTSHSRLSLAMDSETCCQVQWTELIIGTSTILKITNYSMGVSELLNAHISSPDQLIKMYPAKQVKPRFVLHLERRKLVNLRIH